MAASCLWAAANDPGSIEGQVGFTVQAQQAHDIHKIRALLTQALAPEK